MGLRTSTLYCPLPRSCLSLVLTRWQPERTWKQRRECNPRNTTEVQRISLHLLLVGDTVHMRHPGEQKWSLGVCTHSLVLAGALMKFKLKAEPFAETDANCALLQNHRPGTVLRKWFQSWHKMQVACTPHQGKDMNWSRAQVQEIKYLTLLSTRWIGGKRPCRVLNQDALVV